MSMRVTILLVVLLSVATIASLVATPLAAGWALKPFNCDVGGSPDWLATVINIRHLVSFGVLATLAFLVFRHQPIWVPILFMIAVTGSVEAEEGIFAYGHCRLRDMIPNVLAIGAGWLVVLAAARISRLTDKFPKTTGNPG